MPSGAATVEHPGNGTLLLKGGVLKIYSSSSDTDANLCVGSVAITFRYDQSRVQSHQTLTLYRYTGTAWVRVGGGPVTPDHRIATAAPLSSLSSADANIGWFALAARDSGTVIVIN
ncbi:MAG: hypothetical protein PHO37_07345 [Kiritimatiellae bacterium]|nr:hypothetical protein [Kiritimatiellia bacterium]